MSRSRYIILEVLCDLQAPCPLAKPLKDVSVGQVSDPFRIRLSATFGVLAATVLVLLAWHRDFTRLDMEKKNFFGFTGQRLVMNK
jgi:hypothetical protein